MKTFSRPFHQSDINKYITCPRQFYYQNILELPEEYRHPSAIVGICLHMCIHEIHKDHLWDLSPGDIDSLFARHLTVSELAQDNLSIAHNVVNPPPVLWDLSKPNKEGLIADAHEALLGYSHFRENRNSEVILSESSFRLNINDFKFEGFIDQIRKFSSASFELVDFKFSNYKPSPFFLDLSYQFSIYALALSEGEFNVGTSNAPDWISFGDIPKNITWWHLRDHTKYKRNGAGYKAGQFKGPVRYETHRTLPQLDKIKDDISTICTLIKNGSFPRSPSNTGSCVGFCRFHDACMNELEGLPLNYNRYQSGKQLADLTNL